MLLSFVEKFLALASIIQTGSISTRLWKVNLPALKWITSWTVGNPVLLCLQMKSGKDETLGQPRFDNCIVLFAWCILNESHGWYGGRGYSYEKRKTVSIEQELEILMKAGKGCGDISLKESICQVSRRFCLTNHLPSEFSGHLLNKNAQLCVAGYLILALSFH